MHLRVGDARQGGVRPPESRCHASEREKMTRVRIGRGRTLEESTAIYVSYFSWSLHAPLGAYVASPWQSTAPTPLSQALHETYDPLQEQQRRALPHPRPHPPTQNTHTHLSACESTGVNGCAEPGAGSDRGGAGANDGSMARARERYVAASSGFCQERWFFKRGEISV